MAFKVVIEPYSLLWPEAFHGGGAFRGKAGYIVDDEAPMEDVFLEGQEKKLRAMTKREREAWERKFVRPLCASTINNEMAMAAIAMSGRGKQYRPAELAGQLKANAAAAAINAEAASLGIPDPDPDPEPVKAGTED